MGDIPFYVGADSIDVWENQKCFLLDENHNPAFIAGVPPDYFSQYGQRWGNPIYDWDYLEKEHAYRGHSSNYLECIYKSEEELTNKVKKVKLTEDNFKYF